MNLERSPSPDTIAVYLTNAIKSNLAKNHVCHCNRCKIENLNVEIHRNPTTGQYAIKSRYIKSPAWVCASTEQEKVYSLYICLGTGKLHYCHANCDGERMTNEDNCQVCCISGIQYQSETVRSWKVSARCVPTVLVNKQDPYMYSRDKEGRVKLSGVHNLKMTQQVLLSSECITTLLFSKKRMQNEIHKHKENMKEAEKCVNKYRRYCDRKGQPKNYIHMVTLYVSAMKKRPQYTHFLMKSEEEKKNIVQQYTKLLIGTWKMVLFKTNLGREMASFFSFKSFLPACLYIMKTGLIMNGLFIIDKSRYLDITLPEANTLDNFGYSKPSFTQQKNCILRAIREVIESNEETSQSLRDYIAYESQKVTF